jgi:hypothetical protein
VQEISGDVHTWELSDAFLETDPRYQLAVIAAQYAELLRNSYWAGDTTYAELSGHAGRLALQLAADEDVAELAALIERAATLHR